MPKTKDVELLEPFDHHDKLITKITLKEPTGGLYAELGEPRILVRTGQGGYYVEQVATIKSYMDRCIDHPDGSELLKLMGLSDALQVKNELFSFFADAEARMFAKTRDGSSSASV